jgi:hypothetical protein
MCMRIDVLQAAGGGGGVMIDDVWEIASDWPEAKALRVSETGNQCRKAHPLVRNGIARTDRIAGHGRNGRGLLK